MKHGKNNNFKQYQKLTETMGKNQDVVLLLLIVIIGMFIPFLLSIAYIFKLNLLSTDGWITISSTFGVFLLIFGFELMFVFLYFRITNSIAEKKINQQKKKKIKK